MTDASPFEQLAVTVVDLIRSGRFDELQRRFVPMLHGVISESGLRDAWQVKVARYGELRTTGVPIVSPASQGMMVARVDLGFDHGAVMLVIAMLGDRLVNIAIDDPAAANRSAG